MAVVVGCLVMVAVALAGTVRWRSATFTPPTTGADGWRDRAGRAIWWVELAVATVLFSGLLVVGAGGRLAMRLLGALAGDAAQGRITEADEIVGEVTLSGTIGFMVFVGILTGGAGVIVYLLLRRWLPAGLGGGLAFGAGALIVLGTRSDPLRADNPDFDIVGPWWASLLVFTLLALGFGAATSTFAAGFSRWLPLPGRDRRSLAYLLLLILVPLFPFGLLAVSFVGLMVFGAPFAARTGALLRRPRAVLVGRVVLVGLVLVALPGFVSSVADIVGRGPSLG